MMGSIADDLRGRTRAAILALPEGERIAAALALGDDDLALFMRSTGLERSDALRRLRRQRASGRVPSGCGQQS